MVDYLRKLQHSAGSRYYAAARWNARRRASRGVVMERAPAGRHAAVLNERALIFNAA